MKIKGFAFAILGAAGLATGPAAAQSYDDWPPIATYTGPGFYETCNETECAWVYCDDNGCSVIFTYPRRNEVAPPRP